MTLSVATEVPVCVKVAVVVVDPVCAKVAAGVGHIPHGAGPPVRRGDAWGDDRLQADVTPIVNWPARAPPVMMGGVPQPEEMTAGVPLKIRPQVLCVPGVRESWM